MITYKNGKIYKIISNQTDKIYIGSTAEKYLSNRLRGHRKDLNKWKNGKYCYVSSFKLLKYPDHKIILIENYPCDDVYQLRTREQYWIDQYKDICVNIINAQREKDKEKISNQKQEYYQKNREKFLEKAKVNAEKNRDKIIQYKKEYYQKNKNKLLEQYKEYREKNRDKF